MQIIGIICQFSVISFVTLCCVYIFSVEIHGTIYFLLELAY